MNDDHNPLDNTFREKLANHEIQPGDHVWEGIQTAIQKRSRRIWLILAPLILVLAAFIFYLIADINPTTPAETNNDETSERILSEQESENLSNNSTLIENKNNSQPTSSVENKVIRPNESSRGNADKLNTTPASSKNATYFEQNTASGIAAVDAKRSVRTSSSNINKESQIGTEKQEISAIGSGNSIKSSTVDKSQSANTEVSGAKTSTSSEISTISDRKKETQSFTFRHLSETAELEHSNEGFQRFTVSHFRKNEEEHKKALNEIDLCALMNPKTNECPTFKDLNRRFQIDVYGLLGKKFTGLSTNDNIPGVGSYLNNRRSSETPLWNVGVGIRLANQWTNGVSVKGGLQISRGQIRLNYLDESQRTTVVNVSVDTIVDDMGNTTVVWDTISIVETNIVPVEEYNNFTLLDIPVTVGYTFLGRDFDIELNAGVMINVLFSKEGHILGSEEDEVNSINPTDQGAVNAYREDLGFSILTSAAINYHLTDQISVFAEPQLRYFLQPVSPELYSLRENWFHFNLMLGTRYSF